MDGWMTKWLDEWLTGGWVEADLSRPLSRLISGRFQSRLVFPTSRHLYGPSDCPSVRRSMSHPEVWGASPASSSRLQPEEGLGSGLQPRPAAFRVTGNFWSWPELKHEISIIIIFSILFFKFDVLLILSITIVGTTRPAWVKLPLRVHVVMMTPPAKDLIMVPRVHLLIRLTYSFTTFINFNLFIPHFELFTICRVALKAGQWSSNLHMIHQIWSNHHLDIKSFCFAPGNPASLSMNRQTRRPRPR